MLILSSTVHKWNLRSFFRTFLRIFTVQEIETHVSSQHKAGWVLPLRLIGESCVSQSDHFLWVRLPLRHWKHICGVWGLLSLRSQSHAPVCVYVRVGVRACVRACVQPLTLADGCWLGKLPRVLYAPQIGGSDLSLFVARCLFEVFHSSPVPRLSLSPLLLFAKLQTPYVVIT